MSTGARFTCLSCQVAFVSPEGQRDHMRTDWHRYNLKRKAADLPPIAAVTFAQKLQEQQSKQMQEVDRAEYASECQPCHKAFASEGAYKSHVASKKHKETVAKWEQKQAAAAAAKGESSMDEDDEQDGQSKAAQQPQVNWHLKLSQAKTEDEIEAILQEKMASCRMLAETDCLFCSHGAASFEDNLSHMAKAHSFFIPDIEFLVDIKGLIKYLADKVAVANVCILCNGKGRTLHSIEAVQHHMVSKGHCMIPYEDGQNAEFDEFYDFSAQYEDEDDEDVVSVDGDDDEEAGEWEDDENATEADDAPRRKPKYAALHWRSPCHPAHTDADTHASFTRKQAYVSEDTTELVLPSGIRVGHRAFRTYWNQTIRTQQIVPGSRDDPAMITRMSDEYKLLGYTNPQSFSSALIARQKKKMRHERQQQTKHQMRAEYEFRTRIGYIRNNQKHVVDPNRPTQ
ncbi:C2H2 type zinc-finger-domain-containing protein [Entophlyctis helioformis]|nr:C2H2 type zinc-finger-domain-containing protein [Entophlyctis helioformis]